MWQTEPNFGVQPNGLGCEPVSREFVNIGASLKDGLPYLPWAAELVKTRSADPRIRPVTNGRPIGLVVAHTFPAYRRIVQVPGRLLLLNEYNSTFRQIFTDGRPLPEDPNPAWDGYSSGKWEGDVLVIRSNGFRDGTWLDVTGNPLTEAAKMTERFRRANFGTLDIEITVDDPGAYTRPWTVKIRQSAVTDTDLVPYYLDNERDIQHMGSK